MIFASFVLLIFAVCLQVAGYSQYVKFVLGVGLMCILLGVFGAAGGFLGKGR